MEDLDVQNLAERQLHVVLWLARLAQDLAFEKRGIIDVTVEFAQLEQLGVQCPLRLWSVGAFLRNDSKQFACNGWPSR